MRVMVSNVPRGASISTTVVDSEPPSCDGVAEGADGAQREMAPLGATLRRPGRS